MAGRTSKAGARGNGNVGNRTKEAPVEPDYFEVTSDRTTLRKGTVARVHEEQGDSVIVSFVEMTSGVDDNGTLVQVPAKRMVSIPKKTFENNSKKTKKPDTEEMQ